MSETPADDLPDLAAEALGGAVLYANDEFFAEKENLLKPHDAEWREHAYTDRGKWMDGWESRRKRVTGHDFAIVRLGVPGVIRAVDVDTSFFRGNFPAEAALDGVALRSDATVEQLLDEATAWTEILPRERLSGHTHNRFALSASEAVTHVRFRIYPDGGVARLRLFGEPLPDWRALGGARNEIDLAALENGARALQCSDMFFGKKNNLLLPGRAANMSSGWETRRRRGPGHDWVTVRLVGEGMIDRLELDTNHFKGNFPDRALVEGCVSSTDELDSAAWQVVVPKQKLAAHTRHLFTVSDGELEVRGPFTHLRLSVFPDGGVSRMRVWGRLTGRGLDDAAAKFLNTRSAAVAERAVLAACAAKGFASRLVAARPFVDGAALWAAADAAWQAREAIELDEAMAAHPRIGEKKAASKWSTEEQSRVGEAQAETLAALGEVNRAYEEKFGHVFLICATGKSADEMLAAARTRLENTAEVERENAAAEQHAITKLRLRKLIGG